MSDSLPHHKWVWFATLVNEHGYEGEPPKLAYSSDQFGLKTCEIDAAHGDERAHRLIEAYKVALVRAELTK